MPIFGSVSSLNYSKFWPQYCLELRDVYIGGGGAIYHEDGKLHKLANFNYCFWKNLHNNEVRPNNPIESINYSEEINLKQFEIKELSTNEDYIFAHHFHNIYVFGHVWDVFQDLEKIELLNLSNPKLIVPQMTNHVNDLKFHLELFGYSEDKILSLNLPGHKPCNVLYKIPKLYYPSPTAYPSQISKGGRDYLNSKYSKLCSNEKEETKLYLKRPSAKSRSVLNDEEIIKFLKDEGFTIVSGKEGIREHIKLFKNASIIIGAHGSLFRNMIFCEKSPVVYELCPSTRIDYNFLGISKTLDMNYNWLKVEADEYFNISIDIDFLHNILKK
tara:strand:- start:14419 stop:15405 length:987 start_codon:yes stop_codon:yes gene_type:complete